MPPAPSTPSPTSWPALWAAELALALNTAAGVESLGALLPRALNVEGAAAPEWIELIPAGTTVAGVDGRSWANPDPAAVATATKARNRPVPVDWEHATELLAPKGQAAPAAGWIEDVEVRAGALWGKVSWTPRAANQVKDREYRFVSPVFTHARTAPHAIHRLESVGLTNTPNLHLTALNRAGSHPEDDVTLAERLRAALGLEANVGDDAIIAKVTEIKAANSQGSGAVDLTRYAPRGDLETATNRAAQLQGELDAIRVGERDKAIEAELDGAQREGKITPASRPDYLAMCKAEGGLERFQSLRKSLPVLVAGQGAAPPKAPGEGAGGAGLTADQKALCRQMGWNEAEYAKSLKEG